MGTSSSNDLRQGAPEGFPWKRRVAGAALLPLAFFLQEWASRRPEWIEEHFSRGVYPYFSAAQGLAFGWLPISAAEVIIALIGVWAFLKSFGALTRMIRGTLGLTDALIGGMSWVLAVSGVGAIAFLVLWGFNYSRLPLEEQVGWELDPVQADELSALCAELAGEINALRPQLAEDSRGVLHLDTDRRTAIERAESGFAAARVHYPFLAGPVRTPKPAWLSPLMSRLGLSGIYSPLTGEPHVNMDIAPSDLPFTTAHEMAHGLGYARENEANFVGFLACRAHTDPQYRYSGALDALTYSLNALVQAGRGGEEVVILDGLVPGALRDLRASGEHWEKMRSELTEISESVNDVYLKSQRQSAGIASYGLVVELLVAERRERIRAAAQGAEAQSAAVGPGGDSSPAEADPTSAIPLDASEDSDE